MGVSIFGSCRSSPYAAPNSNPNPKRFVIQSELLIGDFLILCVNYPDATNLEGNKVLLYQGFKSASHLLEHTEGELDPHFSNGIGPIARFHPSAYGLSLAIRLAKCIMEQNK